MSAVDDGTQERTQCPLCRNMSLVRHCKGPCGWRECKSVLCNAVLDLTRGLGHHLDPARTIDRGTKQVRRLRLTLINGAWYDRDAA